MEEVINMEGNLTILVHDAHGNVLSSQTVHNLFVMGGRNLLRDLLWGTVTGVNAGVRHIAVGTSDTATADGQTALVAEVYRQVITGTSVTDGALNIQGYLGTSEANGNTLNEAGLFTVSGVMVARALFVAPIEKNASLTVSLSWDLTISAGT